VQQREESLARCREDDIGVRVAEASRSVAAGVSSPRRSTANVAGSGATAMARVLEREVDGVRWMSALNSPSSPKRSARTRRTSAVSQPTW
jgi:hypothetical protein